MKEEKKMLKISKGNNKIGRTWNVSLPPVKSCGKDVPCKKKCYALKSYRMYKNVRAAWDNNLSLWQSDPATFESDLLGALSKARKAPKFFRWHVSGDIVSLEYLRMMARVAESFPETKFLAFTKRYDIVNSFSGNLPENLKIVFSGWPGLAMFNPYKLPVAWMQDGSETRVPADALECPSNCEGCGMCWSLGELNKDVVFHKH